MCDVCLPIILLSMNLSANKQHICSHLSALTLVQSSHILPPLPPFASQYTLHPCVYLSYLREGTGCKLYLQFPSAWYTASLFRACLNCGYAEQADNWVFARPTILQRLHLHLLRERLSVMCGQNQENGPLWQPSALFCCLRQFCSLPNLHPSLTQAKALESTASIQPRRSWSWPFGVGCGEGLSQHTQPLSPYPSLKGLV